MRMPLQRSLPRQAPVYNGRWIGVKQLPHLCRDRIIVRCADGPFLAADSFYGQPVTETTLNLLYRSALAARRLQRRLFRIPTIGVRVLVLYGDEIILVRHRAGRTPWSLPGGGVHRHESFAAAAQREVREEAGIAQVQLTGLHGVYRHALEGNDDTIIVLRAVTTESPRVPSRDLEICEARPFARDQLPPGLDPASKRRIDELNRHILPPAEEW